MPKKLYKDLIVFSSKILKDENAAINIPIVKIKTNIEKFFGVIIGPLILIKNNAYAINGHGILSPLKRPKLNQGIRDKNTAILPKILVGLIL